MANKRTKGLTRREFVKAGAMAAGAAVLPTGVTRVGAATPERKPVVLEWVHTNWLEEQHKGRAMLKQVVGQKYPWITLKDVYAPWEDLRMVRIKKMTSGQGYDLIWEDPIFIPEFVEMGAYKDISSYIPEWIKKSMAFDTLWDPVRYGDQIFGIPIGVNIEPATIVRTDLLKEVGLPEPKYENWTKDDMLNVAKKLTIPGKRWGWAERGRVGPIFQKHFPWHLYASGTDIIERLPNGKWKSAFDKPETVEAVKFYVDLVREYKVSPPGMIGYGFEDWRTGFVTGQIAMGTMGSWIMDEFYVQHKGLQWTAIPLPYKKEPIMGLFGFFFNVGAQCKDPEAAILVIGELLKPENREILINLNWGVHAAARSLLTDPTYVEAPPRKPFLPFIKDLTAGKTKTVWHTKHAKYAQLLEWLVAPTVHRMILGEVEFTQGIKQMDKQVNEILKYRP